MVQDIVICHNPHFLRSYIAILIIFIHQSMPFPLSLSLPLSLLFLLLIEAIHSQSSSIGNDISPSQSQLIIMDTNQYHFVPTGSFFQYSLASWQEGTNTNLIQKITVLYSFIILNNSNQQYTPQYNFIVLFADSNTSQPYTQFNCYVRAVNQGLPQLMQACNFTNNYVNGSCNKPIQLASQNYFSTVNTFFGCNDYSISYNITPSSGIGPVNGTLLFIIDNSGLFQNGNTSSSKEIQLIMTNEVIADVNEEQKAKLYLFSGLTGILILIMIIIAVALNCKIRKLDQELKTSSERIKDE